MFWTTSGLILIQVIACIVSRVYVESNFINIVLDCLSDYSLNAIMPLLISIAMFGLCEKIEIHNGKKLLRKLGTATLGVYLFHDNVNFRVMLWDICKNILGAESNSFILLFIICILVIFIIGTIIEIVRGAVMQKIYDILNDIYRRKNA